MCYKTNRKADHLYFRCCSITESHKKESNRDMMERIIIMLKNCLKIAVCSMKSPCTTLIVILLLMLPANIYAYMNNVNY